MNFISTAYAQTAGVGGGNATDMLMTMAPLILIMIIAYVLVVRPQQKRVKQQQEMISAVRRGDTIVTAGGLIGKVTKVTDDNEVEAEFAPNARFRVMRQMIVEVRAKGEPVKEQNA